MKTYRSGEIYTDVFRYGVGNIPEEYYDKEEVDEHLEVLIQDQKDSNHRITMLQRSIDILVKGLAEYEK